MKKGLKLTISVMVIILLIPTASPINEKSVPLIDGRVSVELLNTTKNLATEDYLGKYGIVGMGYTKDPPRIVIMVESKNNLSEVPREINGIKTKVVVTGNISPLMSRFAKWQTLVGGICISPKWAFNCGTLGVVCRRKGDHENYYILSCTHVIAMDTFGLHLWRGYPIVQPAFPYGGWIPGSVVGHLFKFIKIKFGPFSKNYADAAIAKITGRESKLYEILKLNDESTYNVSLKPIDVHEGDQVRKSGIWGVGESTVAIESVNIKVICPPGRIARFYDVIAVDPPFGSPGDSGSFVDAPDRFGRSKGFVGLLFAGGSDYVFVCKAKYIVDKLGLDTGNSNNSNSRNNDRGYNDDQDLQVDILPIQPEHKHPLQLHILVTPLNEGPGEPVTITVSAEGGSGSYYFTIDFGDGNSETVGPCNSYTTTHIYEEGIYYPSVTVKDSEDPNITDFASSRAVHISELKIWKFTSSRTDIEPGETVWFTVTVKGDNGVAIISIDFEGDGIYDKTVGPTSGYTWSYVYDQEGVYLPKVKIVDDNQAEDVKVSSLEVVNGQHRSIVINCQSASSDASSSQGDEGSSST